MMIQSLSLIFYLLLGSLYFARSLPLQDNDALFDNGLPLTGFGLIGRERGQDETSGSERGNVGEIVNTNVGFNKKLELGPNINGDASLDFGAGNNLGFNFDTGAGWSGIDFDNQFGLDNGLYAGLNVNKYLGLGLNTGLGAGLNTGLGAGLNAGLGAGLNTDLGNAFNTGLGADVGTELGGGVGVGLNAGGGAGLYSGLGVGLNTGVATGFNAGLDSGLNTGLGAGLNVGLEAGLNAGLGAGLNAGIGAGFNAGLSADMGVMVDTEISTRANIDLKESKEALVLFNEALRLELQKNKYFSSVYSERTSPLVLNVITAAIAQRLSSALSIPRSSLSLLENNMSNLPSSITRTTGLYYDIFANSLTNTLSNVHLITPATAKLLVSIVMKAITSAIAYSLRIPFPGTGVIRNNNIFNSYYSVIKGLGKLPYTGIDAIPKLPLEIIIRKSSEHMQKFAEVLFCKLISNNNFIQAFLFGIPENTYKSISNVLGISLADAFGSLNSALFSKLYSNALFRTANKVDYKAYARALSLATAQALHVLGYFTSGDVYIQTDIAANAVIRALIPGLSVPSQAVLFPDVLRLPLGTQLRGVAPELGIVLGLGINSDVGIGSNVDLGIGLNGIGVGLNAGIAAGLNAGIGAGLNAGIGAGLNAGIGAGLNADIGAGLNAGIGAGLNAGIGAGLNADLDAGFNADSGVMVDNGIGLNLGAGIGVNANVGLGVDIGLGQDDLTTEVEVTKAQLSVAKVLTQILANKLHLSTALFTSVNTVGNNDVIELIAQSVAANFGFPVAAVFVNSYYKKVGSNSNTNSEFDVIPLAAALTDTLAEAGLLNSTFTVLKANSLATAIVDAVSSLLATSLEPQLKCQTTFQYGQLNRLSSYSMYK